MVRFKKGIRVLIGIPIIMVRSILFTVGMQIFNVVVSIILFVGHIFIGQ